MFVKIRSDSEFGGSTHQAEYHCAKLLTSDEFFLINEAILNVLTGRIENRPSRDAKSGRFVARKAGSHGRES